MDYERQKKSVVTDEVKNPKVVVVVGNGFDLDLGCPTSYNDFVESKWFDSLITGKPPRELLLEGQYEKKYEDISQWFGMLYQREERA